MRYEQLIESWTEYVRDLRVKSVYHLSIWQRNINPNVVELFARITTDSGKVVADHRIFRGHPSAVVPEHLEQTAIDYFESELAGRGVM